jgi:tetratricopeptide (TPR) repeat protein
LEDKSGTAPALNYLGRVAQQQGDYEQATAFYMESHTLFRELGDKFGLCYTLRNLGHMALHQGDQQQAATFFAESLTLGHELDKESIALCLAGLAGTAVAGAEKQPARLFGAAEVLLEASDARLNSTDQAEYDCNLAATRAQLDEATFAAARAKGRAMTMDQAIAYAQQTCQI